MLFAIISDIHSNLEALQAVLKDIRERDIHEIYCLGDIVGYGPDPDPCLDLIRTAGIHAIPGNHDEAVLQPQLTGTFNALATKAIDWTRAQLSSENLQYLAALPSQLQRHGCLFIHGALTAAHNYINSDAAAAENLEIFSRQYPDLHICFFGHTHISICYGEKRNMSPPHDCSLPVFLGSDERYLINPGACGQPRDGIIDAAYGIYDITENAYIHIRVPYDIETTRQKIYNNPELPDFLGDRLLRGR